MKKKYLLLYLFIFIVFFTKGVYSQTSISGIINQYTVIDSIYPTKDTIEVRNPSLYFADDTVMVYQVKGAGVRTDTSDSNRHNFGTLTASSVGNSGKYEIIRIEKINGDTIILKGNLNNDYDVEGIVQLISVPSYINVSVDGELTCKNWEDTTGGVLVFMVSDTLFLNADINVTGKGFWGAEPFLSDGTCAITDSVLYKSYYFNENATNISAGYKGEGVSEFDPVYRKGLGRWANGGGGGNGRFTGGGGGGNAGNGGTGGAEDTTVCDGVAWPYDNWKGLGGNDGYGFEGIVGTINDSTIFLGGGGGSGTYTNGLSATNGGNGGGVVIIVATNIKTSGYQIIANGDSVSVIKPTTPVSVTNVATASAGGGGAGGVVVFDVDSIIGDLSITVAGGGGGFVESLGEAGPGGGGGGGVIFWKELQPDNISSLEVSGGESGYVNDGYPGSSNRHKASDGGFGSKKNYVRTPLTGFLYNSIISNQDVCWGFNSKLLEGSSLRGGYGPGSYTYQWQDSPDGDVWTDIVGATQEDYQALNLKDTIYYRRVTYSGEIVDYGNDIKIIVHDTIQNNNIFTDSLIACINNLGDTITGTKVVLGGDYENYNYYWQISPDSVSWNNFTSSDINDTIFLPGTISDTSYVRRIVESGACRDTVVPVKIIGLPQIGNNIITAVDEICYDVNPDEITGTLPVDGYGLGSYSYKWQEKTNSSDWITIGGDQQNYDPSNLIDTTYYKRTVYSYDCVDESEVDTIIVLDSIINNIIPLNDTTCYNTQNQIDGSVPIGGRNIYDYQWQESPDASSWSNVTGATSQNYLSYDLTDKTYFRRYVTSGACENTSVNIEVAIDSLPVAKYTGFIDTTICSELPINLEFNVTNGSSDYTLIYNDGENDFIKDNFVEGANTITISPTTLLESKNFTYTIVSVEDQNGCFATDITGVGELTVYGNPTSDAGIDDKSCVLSYNLSAAPSLGTGIWTQLSGTGNTLFTNHTLASSSITVDLAGVYEYKWKETNWECEDSDTVEITLYEKADSVIAGPEVLYLFNTAELDLEGKVYPSSFNPDSTLWEIIRGANGVFDNDKLASTSITNLSDANNTGILLTWSVYKDKCVDEVDTIEIALDEDTFIPKGFTPNGDGVNDVLIPYGLEKSFIKEFIIYNRWGTEVYSVHNRDNYSGWDGKNNGNDLPEDTYYYILKYDNYLGASRNKNGFIVIKRH